ncbi:MAG: lipid-binding SYLF domain-containing protein [Woeseiaceae bacterium]|jgi:lipid-binding SYLF domain-containing protein|nr:lipid-binding SYLF domain-containing protein [Woeseiaceae bacterium]
MKKVLFTLFSFIVFLPLSASADTAAELDAKVDEAIHNFQSEVDGADVFLQQSAGYLVFPRVIKVGIGLGAETGEGALRVGGSSTAYYRTTSGSFGFQLGAQAKSIVIAFMTEESLEQFQTSSGWQVGLDGSVALIDLGAGKQINNTNIKDPVVGFIFGAKGLMYNLTLEGTKISRVQKDR